MTLLLTLPLTLTLSPYDCVLTLIGGRCRLDLQSFRRSRSSSSRSSSYSGPCRGGCFIIIQTPASACPCRTSSDHTARHDGPICGSRGPDRASNHERSGEYGRRTKGGQDGPGRAFTKMVHGSIVIPAARMATPSTEPALCRTFNERWTFNKRWSFNERWTFNER